MNTLYRRVAASTAKTGLTDDELYTRAYEIITDTSDTNPTSPTGRLHKLRMLIEDNSHFDTCSIIGLRSSLVSEILSPSSGCIYDDQIKLALLCLPFCRTPKQYQSGIHSDYAVKSGPELLMKDTLDLGRFFCKTGNPDDFQDFLLLIRRTAVHLSNCHTFKLSKRILNGELRLNFQCYGPKTLIYHVYSSPTSMHTDLQKIQIIQALCHRSKVQLLYADATLVRQLMAREESSIPEDLLPLLPPFPEMKVPTENTLLAKLSRIGEVTAHKDPKVSEAIHIFYSEDNIKPAIARMEETFTRVMGEDFCKALKAFTANSEVAIAHPERVDMPFYIPTDRINSENHQRLSQLAFQMLQHISTHLKGEYGAHLFFVDGYASPQTINSEIKDGGIPIEANLANGLVHHGYVTHLFQVWSMLLITGKANAKELMAHLMAPSSKVGMINWDVLIDKGLNAIALNNQHAFFHILLLSKEGAMGNFARLIYELTLYEHTSRKNISLREALERSLSTINAVQDHPCDQNEPATGFLGIPRPNSREKIIGFPEPRAAGSVS